jgi:hypothetical protein
MTLPELPQAEILDAVKSAADALQVVSADTPEAIGRLAGQILLTRAQLLFAAELARSNSERDAIPRTEAAHG